MVCSDEVSPTTLWGHTSINLNPEDAKHVISHAIRPETSRPVTSQRENSQGNKQLIERDSEEMLPRSSQPTPSVTNGAYRRHNASKSQHFEQLDRVLQHGTQMFHLASKWSVSGWPAQTVDTRPIVCPQNHDRPNAGSLWGKRGWLNCASPQSGAPWSPRTQQCE